MKPRPLAVALATAIATLSIAAVSSTREAELAERAAQGSTQAVVDLAEFYRAQGRREEAMAVLRRSAETGNAVAHRLLAEALLQEPGRFEEAEQHYREAARLGDRMALHSLGRELVVRAMDTALPDEVRAGMAQRAQRLLQAATRDEDPKAMWLMGYLMLHGPGAVRDPEAGRFLLGKAADRGQVAAAYLLAREDLPAFGAERDHPILPAQKEAFERGFARLRQAAEGGHRQAAAELATHYRRGVWVRRDLEEASRWDAMATASAKQASIPETLQVQAAADAAPAGPVPEPGVVAHSAASPVSPDALEALEAEVRRLSDENERLRKALARAETERDEALAKLAQSEADYRALHAYRALQVGADELNRSALDHIARSEFVAARPLLEAAARAGHAGAIANLAWFHLHGITVPANPRLALELFERAAELGNAVAAQNLARMYALGIGVPVDPERAQSWTRRSLALAAATEAPAVSQR